MNKTKESIIRIFLAILAAIFTVLYIGPVITTGQINIGILTGFMLAAAALIYSVFFRKINLILKKATAKKLTINENETDASSHPAQRLDVFSAAAVQAAPKQTRL